MPTTLTDRFATAMQTLDPIGQDHVLTYYDRVDDVCRDQLLDQIEAVDWPEVARLVETHVKHKPEFSLPEDVQPAPCYPYEPTDDAMRAKYAQARKLGEELVGAGKVAAFTVAGGQGTRLGWKGPKGTFPATPIRELPLFACFAEYLHNVQKRFDCVVPWYVMTSPVNHADTLAFFEKQNYFGLDPANVMLFPQAMMPAIDMNTGKVLLATTSSLALSPNGHGGSLKALYTSGAIADMRERGVEQISYFQVDNPIVRCVDPLFIGLHAMDNAQMSSKMLPKAAPMERLGNFALVDGKMTVIEYSDLPEELAYQTLDNGELRFRAGSIAIHVIRVDFVESLNAEGGFGLPFHRAEKKVEHVDLGTGQTINPTSPNAVKLETFVFDALPMCENSIVYEADRGDEFAPIKNASGDGVVDSSDTSRQLQIDRSKAWLRDNGVEIADGAVVEVTQVTAIYPQDLASANLPDKIGANERVVI